MLRSPGYPHCLAAESEARCCTWAVNLTQHLFTQRSRAVTAVPALGSRGRRPGTAELPFGKHVWCRVMTVAGPGRPAAFDRGMAVGHSTSPVAKPCQVADFFRPAAARLGSLATEILCETGPASSACAGRIQRDEPRLRKETSKVPHWEVRLAFNLDRWAAWQAIAKAYKGPELKREFWGATATTLTLLAWRAESIYVTACSQGGVAWLFEHPPGHARRTNRVCAAGR